MVWAATTARWVRRGYGGSALLALATTFAAAPAAAQTVQGPPTREEIERSANIPVEQPPAAALSVDGDVERAPCPLARPEFTDIRFRLDRVDFTGLEMVDPESLRGSYAEYLGNEVSVATICEIRDRAATYLRQQGYVAAVQVPPQQIDQGTVRLDVLMARIGQVQVRGDAGASEKLLRRYINKIAAQPVFNINEAERYLLLARDIPGLDVRLSLRPSEGQPGTVIGEFAVVQTPFYADLTIQNLGTRAVGRYGALARARFNGLTGLGDETVLTAYATLDFDEQFVIEAAHSFRIGGEGLTLGADFTYSWTDPSVSNGDFQAETLVANVEANYPFVRSQARNLFGAIGFDYIDQNVDFGALPLTSDTLSVIYARLSANRIARASISGRDGYSVAEPHWAMAGTLELRQGLDIFGASEGCGPGLVLCQQPGFVGPSRAEGDATAFVVRFDGRFDYRPTPDWLISIQPRGQYAPDPLLSYEEISGGNFTVGRGYDPGIIIGDSGVGVRSELAYGSTIPKDQGAIALQPYGFFDALWVWNEDRAFDGIDPQKLFSLGGGLRATIGNGARFDASLAVPLRRAGLQTETGDVRFLFTLTVQLAPWNFR